MRNRTHNFWVLFRSHDCVLFSHRCAKPGTKYFVFSFAPIICALFRICCAKQGTQIFLYTLFSTWARNKTHNILFYYTAMICVLFRTYVRNSAQNIFFCILRREFVFYYRNLPRPSIGVERLEVRVPTIAALDNRLLVVIDFNLLAVDWVDDQSEESCHGLIPTNVLT